LNEKVISGLESLPELAQETRANYLDTLFMDNINAAVEFGTYLVGFASITAGFLLGEAASLPFNLVGYVISDLAYTYEYFVEFERISKDCTTDLEINTSALKSDISASYGALSNGEDNDGIIPEQYWVLTASIVEDIRSTLSCVSDSALETQLKLVEKAGKLRTKLIKRKETIELY